MSNPAFVTPASFFRHPMQSLRSVMQKAVEAQRGDPAFWEYKIREFESADRAHAPTEGVIVFTGSSSINFWDSLERDMLPLRAVNRGFGGSQMHQVVHFVERIVLPYRPRAVVVYAGDNDLAGLMFSRKRSPAEIRNSFRDVCAAIHARQPETPVYYLSIKPSRLRWKLWPSMQEANRLIEQMAQTDARIHYIDVAAVLLKSDGTPRRDAYKWDGLHLNDTGYALWTSVIKTRLISELGVAQRPRPAAKKS